MSTKKVDITFSEEEFEAIRAKADEFETSYAEIVKACVVQTLLKRRPTIQRRTKKEVGGE